MTDIPRSMPLPEYSESRINWLANRRSNLAKAMTAPGPQGMTLEAILTIAARVPDHRKLAPWRFIVFTGDNRTTFGQHISDAFIKQYPDMPAERVSFEAARFERAPVVVAVISAPVDCPRGTPIWEQELSAGAVCYNMLLAAQAHGYAAQWLTEWYAYNSDVTAAMGMTGNERVAGFIYMGTAQDAPTERVRPDMDARTHMWMP